MAAPLKFCPQDREKSWADSEIVHFSVFHFYLKGKLLLKYRSCKPVTTMCELQVQPKTKTEGKDRSLMMRQNNC